MNNFKSLFKLLLFKNRKKQETVMKAKPKASTI